VPPGPVRLLLVSIDGFAGFYWDDPRARTPTLHALAERGVVAPAMETVLPSTTWPTHVSVVTGVRPLRHGVVGNSILDRASGRREDLTGDPVHDAAALLRAPTLYDCAHAAGRRTAAVDWPATRHAATLDFNLPFFKDQRVFEAHTDAAVWAELAALGHPMDRQGEWAALPRRFLKDRMVAEVAAHVWIRHAPALLLAHVLCVDSHQHLWGPRSPEAYWAIEYVDRLLGDLLAALPPGALDADTVVAVVSDHGFLPVERDVRVNVALRRWGVLETDGEGAIRGGEARFVMNHGAGYLYLGGTGDRARLAADLGPALARLEGVAQVWTAAEYARLGLPRPEEHPHVGDLLLEARPGYCFADEAAGDAVVVPPRYRGSHGHSPAHADNAAFFLAAGPGIARGRRLPPITSRDVAPTLARRLGLVMEGVEGRVLEEALA
jgi:predicted AlkP superfamily pyrophosphatase or phosphodiesterase